MTKVEQVALAIDKEPEWPAATYRQRVARAAIEAMKAPSDEMLNAIEAADWQGQSGIGWEAGFEIMIDAALSEPCRHG
jgi:hypothetical protein